MSTGIHLHHYLQVVPTSNSGWRMQQHSMADCIPFRIQRTLYHQWSDMTATDQHALLAAPDIG